MTKVKPLKEDLEKLYIIQKLSVKKISLKFEVTTNTVKKWIDSYKLEYRGFGPRKIPKNFIRPSKEELSKLYNFEKLSLREIGEKYKVTKTTIKRWFNEYELKVRSNPTEARLAKKNIILPTKEQLIKDYEFFSLELIAKKYGISTEPILTLLNKYNIEKRNRSESQKLAEKTGRVKIWNKGLSMENPKIAKIMDNLHKKQMEKIDIIRKKVSETRKKLYSDGKLESWNKGKKLSKEHREKLSKIKKEMFTSEEARVILRERGLKAPTKSKGTKPEKIMKQILLEAGLDKGLVEQYPLKMDKIATRTDFAYPEYKIAIYCDGEYWHGGLAHINQNFETMKDGPRKDRIKKTMKKDSEIHFTLWKNGWIPLRFWQHEIEENPEFVIKKIKDNLFNKNYIKEREKQREELLSIIK